MTKSLTARQQREIDYHRDYARQRADMARYPIAIDVVTNDRRRWWNAYWHTYTILRGYDLQEARVLIPGCGFGEDAARIAHMGANVHAFDISSEITDIAKERCANLGHRGIQFAAMPAEDLIYEDDFFDFVFCIDVLHHVDISAAITQFRRVLKSGGRIIGNELYTHSLVQRLFRRSYLVEKLLYPRMARYIYGTNRPYITEDEHKIDEKEFEIIHHAFVRCRVEYFNIFVGRILPERSVLISKTDRTFAHTIGRRLSRYFAGRIVFDGLIRK